MKSKKENKIVNQHTIKKSKEKTRDLLEDVVNDLDDAGSGNQMDDDILSFEEDALVNPNPTKQGKEENERPGGGLRK